MAVYNINDYTGTDRERICAAVEDAGRNPGSVVVIPPGTYELTSELARREQYNVMHGVYGENPQRIMFNPKYEYTRGICFSGHRGTVLSAYGATFIVDGFMEPVSVRDCKNVTVEGFTVDHRRKPYSKGIIISCDGNEITVEYEQDIYEGTPFHLRNCIYDITADRYHDANIRLIGITDSRHAVFKYSGSDAASTVGREIYHDHTFHSRPAILVENASDTVIRNVTIHSQPGMGIVGNRSENILISGLRVIPSPGHHFSTNTDATHFTSIKGLLRFENCDFEGQGDDSANIHGYYHTIFPTGTRSCRLREETPDGTHAQTLDYPDVGDTLELTRVSDLKVADTYTVEECVPVPEEWCCEVVLDHGLPENAHEIYNFADITRLPRVEFVNCHSRNHYARGLLLKSRGALIEGNTFAGIMGDGIEIAAESWWKEGVCPADVVVRRNRIMFCGGGISVMADSSDPTSITISNIVIEDNIIECPGSPGGISVRNCDGVLIARNHIICAGEKIAVSCSENVVLDGNV